MSNNKFIVVEGIDGSGKTTFITNLVATIKKHFPEQEVVVVSGLRCVATGERLCESISSLTKEKLENYEIKEVIAAKAAEVHELSEAVITTHLNAGKVVIFDRWIPSYMAYQVIAEGTDVAVAAYDRLLALYEKLNPTVAWMDTDPDLAYEATRVRGGMKYHDLKGKEHFKASSDAFFEFFYGRSREYPITPMTQQPSATPLRRHVRMVRAAEHYESDAAFYRQQQEAAIVTVMGLVGLK